MKISDMLNRALGARSANMRWGTTSLSVALALLFLTATAAFAQDAPTELDFQRNVVAEGLDLPMEFAISEDGRVFIASKCGVIYAWNLDSGTPAQTATVPNVRCVFEDGLLSVALDPNFTQNNYIYFQYTSPGSLTRVSRFTVNPDNSLDLASESIVLQWTTGDEAHGHMGGSLQFAPDGNLIITTGDNKAAGGYFQPAAQGTSGNTNDLRGKVLRITPTPDGSYTIPPGNLFAGDALHRPEIYAMGFRNPFRLNVDPLTGYLYVGDIGPDASTDSAEGPGGLDEINELREAGNYGWPYIIGYNQPYAGFDPNNIVNNAPDNTGATNLPDAKPALWTIRHQATMAGPVYRFDESIDNEFKLPAYYNGRLIFWDFNSSNFFTFNLAAGNSPPIAEDFPLDTSGFQGAIDVELDPRTHQLYVLQWGSGCCDNSPYGGGALYRFDYIGDRDNGTNLSIGSIATATSEAGGNLAMHAVDGDPSTRWESAASDPQTITLDLQQASTIDSIMLVWEAAYSSAYRIEASANGGTWDQLVNVTDGSGGSRLHIIESPNEYRYVRLTGTARGTDYGHSLFEFEVYSGEGDEPPAPLTEFAYLNMPRTLDGNFTDVPLLLSQTGVFSDTANMVPGENLLPFEPTSKLWSDRALKERWISIPADTQVNWDDTENWTYPQGTVAVKHFELPLDANNPAATKRLETRLIVVKADGKVYGVTYKWRADNSDADLLTTGLLEDVSITDSNGSVWTQTWAYPSPTECMDCHNAESAQILGLSTRHLNGDFNYPGLGTQNQLVHWNNLELFNPSFNNAQVASFDKLVDINDTSATLEHRVKSYLDTNCAHCHGTGNGGSQWDARFNTPLNEMQVVDHATTGIRNYFNYYGITDAQIVDSGAPQESILYIRDKSVDPDDRMPPMGRALEHTEYIAVLEQWINSLSGLPQPETLLSAGKPATTSSFEGDYVASLATDGDPNTRWSSDATDPQWLMIDLETVQSISRIVLNWEAAYGTAYIIEGSTDGTNWTTIVTQTNGTGGIETYENLSGNYRYVRLTGTTRGTPHGYSLWEFEVFGSSDIAVPEIAIVAPQPNQEFTEGNAVNLQVSVSEQNWFADGGSYVYRLNNGPAITVSNLTAVNLGALPVGQHLVEVQLIDGTGQAVGANHSVSFNVTSQQLPDAVWLSLNKPVTVSSVEGDFVGANAVDGDPGTRWGSEFLDPQWIEIDLQAAYAISEIRLSWEGAYGIAYTIEGSTDGNDWTTIVTQANGAGGIETFDAVSGSYRFIRLTGTQRATPWGYSLFEFEVWGGTGAPTPQVSITSPAAGQYYTDGDSVSLQVDVSDANWFSNGGSYRYTLDGNNAVQVNSGGAVSLGTPGVGPHSVSVQLVSASGQTVGSMQTTPFTVDAGPVGEPVLVSENKTVTTSAIEGDYAGANAVDGDPNTRWSSAHTDNEFIQIDLGASMSINRILLEWEAAYGTGYIIEVSDDAANWTSIYSTTSGDGGTDDLTVDGQGRYVRLTGTARATPYGYSLWEFQVYSGTSDPVDPDPVTAQIAIMSPASGQQFEQGSTVSLQVSASDNDWFATGGGYRYTLNGGSPVLVANGNAANLGALAVGNHTVQAVLVDGASQPVGDSRSVTFSVNFDDGEPSTTPSPAKLSPIGVTASTEVDINTAASAIDGDPVSRWESERSDPQYLQLDLGESSYITRVTLQWEAAYSTSYTLDVSEDAANWTTVYSTDSGNGGLDDITLDGQQGRYIRMHGTARATGYGHSIFEFEVYGLAADPDLALITVMSPGEDQAFADTDSVQFQVSISDSGWIAGGGSYNYSLDSNPAINSTSQSVINLGVLPTGRHTLHVSLVDSNGTEVSVPRTREFTVNCGNNCPNVLVFSKTAGFRHGSIPAGIAMVEEIGATYGFNVTASEDSSLFTTANLAQYSTIVFMNTTGDILDANQKAAFQSYIENGGGFVGTHSAADTEHNWTWYTDVLFAGAEFIHHGDGIPLARVEIEQVNNLLVNHIGSEWNLADEWYFWESSPRGVGNVEVLANLDRSSYASNYPVEDHPVIFTNIVGSGRFFYTAVGHVDENFSDPNMVEMIRKGIEWTSED